MSKFIWVIIILIVLTIVFWENIRLQIDIFGEDLNEYNCSSSDSDCYEKYTERKANCINSITIIDSSSNTYHDILIKKSNHCLLWREVLRSSLPDVKGIKLRCELPLDKLDWFSTASDIDYFKYCEGSYKDKAYEMLDSFFGI